jgi:uncharacterized protein YjiS (DUF1127 family)
MDTISLGARRQVHAVTRRGPMALLALWLERGRSRRQLRLLLTSPHALADLGLTRDEADLESIRPFWR